MEVLDTSAFIHGYEATEECASIPAVAGELEGAGSYRFDAMEGAGMYVHVPDEAALDTVRRAASESGDLTELSETDRRLLATTLELDGRLVTDDYAMQNVAERLDLDCAVIARDGITEEREWLFQCQGCGREFDEGKDRCPICGTDLARKNPA
ncbi:DNA-binding protein [Halobacteriales archaeon SW_7_68_16]|nr:MAG: DNA-binding protein [Halobacteriales archaeon SW_7_68_16]